MSTSDLDLIVRARRAITPEGERPAAVGVKDGRIVSVGAFDDGEAAEIVELGSDEVLLPGLVDTHVHVNEPGRTEWEGFATATAAAAAGGVTTIIDMPLNSIPATVDVDALAVKRAAANGQVHIDVGMWGGAVPGNRPDLPGLHAAGVFGFKCFLLPSGVPEFAPLDRVQLGEHLTEIAALDGLLIVHAEDPVVIEEAAPEGGPSYQQFLASRPHEAEDVAIATVIDAARRTGARVHIVHLSSAASLEAIAAARSEGMRITVETCPHYLALTAEHVPVGATQYKCCPPIRDEANRDALWAGLDAGVIDLIVTDHSPCPPALKGLDAGDFGAAWGGVASLQLGLAVVWTEAAKRGHSLAQVVHWMAEAPAALVGLTTKGKLAVGCDADFSVFAPTETWPVEGAALRHRHPVTPYSGSTLTGAVRRTWLAGRTVDGIEPRGRILRREGSQP